MDPRKKALHAAGIALDKKGENIVIMDLRKAAVFCDFFVIVSASSNRRVRAIADSIIESLKKHGVKKHHVEGEKDALWVLLDYGDVVAHIFYKEVRDFYDIERLWQDAPKELISPTCQNQISKNYYPIS